MSSNVSDKAGAARHALLIPELVSSILVHIRMPDACVEDNDNTYTGVVGLADW